MILIKPSLEILLMTENPLKIIERAGRTCYKSEGNISVGSAEQFVESILRRGHESVIEHATVTVKIICDRGVTHELVRHRLASYSQESTRYCNYSGGVTFVIPPWLSEFIPVGKYEFMTRWQSENEGARIWFIEMLEAERDYQKLIELGWSPQQARSVLPNSLKTEIVCTANLREWRHIFKLRTAKNAHPQMREITVPLLEKFQSLIPVFFDDIRGKE